MAVIDSKKLLPPSKKGGSIEKQKFLVPLQNISVKKISAGDLRPVDKETKSSGNLAVVKKKITELSVLFKDSYLIDKKERETKRKEEERKKSEQRERKLEKNVKDNKLSSNLIPSIPGQSIFDRINRFIGFTLLGYLFNKYGELLPKLIEFGKVLKPVAEFIESFAKNLLSGVINFVEFGYKAYDGTRNFVKELGGEGAAKTFDEFSKQLNLLLNGAIAASMLIISSSSKKPGGTIKPGAKPSTLPKSSKLSGYLGRDPQTKMIERRYGNDAARMYEARKAQGASVSRARADVLKRFEKFEGPQRGLGGGTGQGSILSRGVGKSFNRASLKVLGKTGTKIAKGVFGRVPIIGGLLDFAFSLAMGENPGRAAAKAVGATVGSALGTFIPVPFAGTILGGILGDIVGGALYDSLIGSSQKPQGRAEGGKITRGGQSTVSPSRRLKTRTKKVASKIQPQKTQPGKDVGGKLKIEELYGKDEPGTRSALRALKKSSEDVKKMRSINGLTGSMFGAGIDMALGQKPDKKLAKSIGDVFGSVVQNAIDAELNNSFGDISKTIAMANGGVVPSREIGRSLSIGERIGKFISSALTISIESSAAKILQNLRNEMNLEGISGESPYDQEPPSGESLEYEVKGGNLPSSYPGRGTESHGYPGRDYQIEVGKAITVFKPGTVVYARLNPSGYGNLVIVRHKDGKQTVYAHLSRINVKEGDEIKDGERKVIGLTGGEAGAPGAGNSTGPHLHFEVRNSQGNKITGYNDGDAYFRFGTVTGVKKRTPLEMSKLKVETTGRELQGEISWYGPGFYGNKTANREVYTGNEMTAAHKTLPFGTLVRVSWKGRSIVVRINDRGPYISGRVLDLSRAAAEALGMSGVANGAKIEIVRAKTTQSPAQLGKVLSSTNINGATYTVREGGKYFKNANPITKDEYDKAFGLQLSSIQPQSPSVALAGSEMIKTDTGNTYVVKETQVLLQQFLT